MNNKIEKAIDLPNGQKAIGSEIHDDLRIHEAQLLKNGFTVIFKGLTDHREEVHGKIKKTYCLIWKK
jgi:hypothetical protein